MRARSSAFEDLLDLVRRHRESAFGHFEYVPVEDAPRLHPGGPHPPGDEELHRRAPDDRLDEGLGGLRRGEQLVVVDHDPAVRGPAVEVLGQHLGEKRRLPFGVLRDRKPLEKPASRAREHCVGR